MQVRLSPDFQQNLVGDHITVNVIFENHGVRTTIANPFFSRHFAPPTSGAPQLQSASIWLMDADGTPIVNLIAESKFSPSYTPRPFRSLDDRGPEQPLLRIVFI